MDISFEPVIIADLQQDAPTDEVAETLPDDDVQDIPQEDTEDAAPALPTQPVV